MRAPERNPSSIPAVGSGDGIRDRHRVLLAAIGAPGEHGWRCTSRRPVPVRSTSRSPTSGPPAPSCTARPASRPVITRRRSTPPSAGAGGRPRPSVAVEPDWPSGYYEVHPDDRRRRQGPPQPTPSSSCVRTSRRPPHGSCSRCRRTPGTPTTTSAAATSTPAPPRSRCSARWRPGYLYKPPGAGQRVTSLHPPDPQSASHVGYLRMNHLSPYGGSAGWPNWELPFVRVGGAGGLRDRRRHERRPRGASRAARRRTRRTGCTCRSATTSTGPARCATPSRGSSPAAATLRSSPGTPRSGRCATRIRPAPTAPDRRPRWSATRASSSATRSTTPSDRPSSPRSGRITSSSGPRTT